MRLIVEDGRIKLGLVGWDQGMEVHEVLSEGSRFVEAAELYHAAHDDLVLGNAEDPFLLQSLHGVDNTKGHTDGQGRRHCDGDQIEELHDQVHQLHVLMDEDDQHDEGADREAEKKDQILVGLSLEDVVLLLGEEDDPDELALGGHEVRTDHTDRDAVLLSE